MARERKRIRPVAERVPRKRRRRAPEVARAAILDAAERVFGRRDPGEVGLKDIGRQAGVSHALITHYFGTYAGLVQATLERRLVAVRMRIAERLRDAGVLSRPEELLAMLFEALQDPVHLRLMKWLTASERAETLHTFALQQQGLAVIARQVAAALRAEATANAASTPNNAPAEPDGDDREAVRAIELVLVTAVAAALGYAIHRHALAGTIGTSPGPELDAAVQRTLAGMVRTYMQSAPVP